MDLNCYKCGIKLKTEREKNDHMTENHNHRKDDRKRNYNDVVKSTKYRDQVNASQRSQYRYVCPPCGKRFTSQKYLNNHIEYRHMIDVRPKCIHCNVSFSNKWDETDHYSRKHYRQREMYEHDDFSQYDYGQYYAEGSKHYDNNFPPLKRSGNSRRAGRPARY